VPKLTGQPLAKAATTRDGALWNDDTIEIFLDPRHTHGDYYQFLVNAAGTVADARGRDLSWNGDWTARVAENDQSWGGIATIPLATLGVTAINTGDIWPLMSAWNRSPAQRPVDWAQEEQNLTWARLGSGSTFHEPVSFGHLIFGPQAVQLTEVGQPWWRAPRFVAHTPGSDGTVEMRAKPNGPGGFWTCAEAPSTGPDFTFQMPKGDALWPGDYTVSFTARAGDQPLAYLYSECVARRSLTLTSVLCRFTGRCRWRRATRGPIPRLASQWQAQLIDSSSKPLRQGELRLAQGHDGDTAGVVAGGTARRPAPPGRPGRGDPRDARGTVLVLAGEARMARLAGGQIR